MSSSADVLVGGIIAGRRVVPSHGCELFDEEVRLSFLFDRIAMHHRSIYFLGYLLRNRRDTAGSRGG